MFRQWQWEPGTNSNAAQRGRACLKPQALRLYFAAQLTIIKSLLRISK
jgi:hypothetical protein